MHCPYCNHNETIVKDSRIVDNGTSIKRRRFCIRCNERFTTFERLEIKEIMVEKKSGETEFFNRAKLKESIKMSLRKHDRYRSFLIDIIKTINDANESLKPKAYFS